MAERLFRIAICRAFALALGTGMASGCSGETPPAPGPAHSVLPVEECVLRIAGSGALGPLAKALGSAYGATPQGGSGSGSCLVLGRPVHDRVVVEDSIGSGGGVRAVADGAVDIGLISRRLSDAESRLGLTVVPIAADVVVIAAHPDVSIAVLTSDQLCALYAGASHRFPDGSPAVVLLRDRGESANLALEAGLPCMRETLARIYQADGAGHRVLYHDDVMAAALALTPGAIGVYSLPLLRASRLPLKTLDVDGLKPTVAAVAGGSWKLTRPLAFVLRPERVARAQGFLDFAISPAGRAIAEASGCLPVPAIPPPPIAAPSAILRRGNADPRATPSP